MGVRNLILLTFWILLGGGGLAQTDSLSIQQDITEAGYTNPQTYMIADLEISGDTHYTKNQIMRFTGLRLGEQIDIPGAKINNSLKKLWNSNLFSNIDLYVAKVEGDKIYLRLHLIGLPEMAKVHFTGLRKGKREDFTKEFNLNLGTKITNNLKSQIRNSIKNHFLERGYPNAKIDFVEKPSEDDPTKIDLHINVAQGKRVKIKNIEFEGNNELRDGQLRRKAMKNTRRTSLNFLRSSKFIPSKYKEDLNKVVEEYKSIGYRDAKIVSDTVITTDSGKLLIKIKIDEGRPYYLGNVTFTGNSVYSTEILERVFAYQKGDRYDAVGINKKVSGSEKDDDIQTLYMDRGYLFSNVIPIEKNVKNDTIDLEIKIMEGEPATFNRVTFSGNDVTYDHVIARELRTQPGDLFSKSEIKRTYFELASLGYFEPTQINPEVKPHPETNTVDLNWELVHKSSSQVELQAGYGARTFLGTLGLSFGNFSVRNLFKKGAWRPVPMGDGQSLSLRAQGGRGYQNYSFSFVEPWIGGRRPTALSTSVYYSRYTYTDIYRERGSINIVGINAGLNKLLTWPDDWFRLSHTLSYQLYKFDNYPLQVGSLRYDNGSANDFSYTIGVTRNSAGPDPIFPTGGADIGVSLSLTPPYSLLNGKDYSKMSDAEKINWLEYYKIKVRSYWYKELIGKLVVKVGGEFGYLGSYNTRVGEMPFQRFYLGGTGMMGNRFDGREIIPLRGYDESSSTGGGRDEITPLGGGSIYNKFTFELRYPITMGQQAKIFALTFLEGGNTWANNKEYKPFELKRSAGVGVRIFMSAFGMLGFDFGYGFDPNLNGSEPSGWQTHFILGQQF